MAATRRALRVCSRARVTGVAFFDFEHGQTGVAPNAIELHPIRGFRCLSGPSRLAGLAQVRRRPVPAPVRARQRLGSFTSRPR
jgi:hypothetical protein